MWLPLLWIALIAAPPVDTAQLLQNVQYLQQRSRDESYLLNQQIRMPMLAIWDAQRREWRSPTGAETKRPRGMIRVVHLWADYCAPCRAEFPRLKKIAEQMQLDSPRDVQFIFVSETQDSEAMQKFLMENRDRMPAGVQYGDTNLDLMHTVMQALPQSVQAAVPRGQPAMSREPPLPLTLVLDQEDVVRFAFVGSMEGRHGELVSGVAQLLRLLKTKSAAMKLPSYHMLARRPDAAPRRAN